MLAKYAIAGAGLSAGHSAWKYFQKNIGLFLILFFFFGAIYLPFAAGQNMTKGHPQRKFWGTLFKTIICNVVLIALSYAMVFMILAGLLKDVETDINIFELSYRIILVLFAIGFAYGRVIQRPERYLAYKIERENEAFLSENGIKETGAKDITHYDSNDNPLRFIEAQKDRLSFMVVGARGKRAFLHMDERGRFTKYSPPSS